jgi:hypothetical protein
MTVNGREDFLVSDEEGKSEANEFRIGVKSISPIP